MKRLSVTVASIAVGMISLAGVASASVDTTEASGLLGPFETWDSCENNRYWHDVKGYQTWPCFMEDNQKWWYHWSK
ncbi:hypothetical protein [Amycolatopsis sp. WAC 01376]|uniref:hypothetical protein n=1 Tax=Amycolatopsis sp. WAC 01376 TaxID=2203195 RepID=UPI000F7B8BCD|nr:hypothetical protein [Amycolatopsis sp. WAC 01376]